MDLLIYNRDINKMKKGVMKIMNRFDWNRFDKEFINAIVYSGKTPNGKRPTRRIDDKDMLIPSIEKIASRPDIQFILTYRKEIELKLLQNQPEHVKAIYKSYTGFIDTNFLSMLKVLSSKPLGSILANAYQSVLYSIGRNDESSEVMSDYINPTKTVLPPAGEIPLFDFQDAAVRKLNEKFLENNNSSGLLVMPTGSGKTRTATYFLLKNMISQGYQIVWLTHRHMLIDQTADAFIKYSTLIKLVNPDMKTLKMSCVSGEHSSINATEKDDNIMVISIQSVCRSLDYLKKVLAKKVIIVVDEAHHTVAMSYRKTIDYIRKIRKDAKLLGLTATPMRGTDSETKYLMELFGNNIIYDISMSELITKQILAKPTFERIETNADFEPIISIDEGKLINKYKELPATLVDKIARSSKRNQVIVDTYIKGQKKYGKTLIFALNAYHCFTLNEDLQKEGVKCDYIYSGNFDNQEKIRRFKANELDVLININILTEGSDVPDIQTVFLTRPTQSDGLLMQMIGRGMRGKLAGGTDEVNIVDFCDKWDTFNKWLNPQWLMADENLMQTPPSIPKPDDNRELVSISWDLIRDIYTGITHKGDDQLRKTLALPAGWYCLLEDEEDDYRMFVWEEQLLGFANMLKNEREILSNGKISSEILIQKYFGGFTMPPSKADMEVFLKNWRESEAVPHFFSFENREKIDPMILAYNFKEENVGIIDLEDRTRAIYETEPELIHNIYGDFENYYGRIIDCLKYKDGIKPINRIFEEIPIELIPFRMEPTYDLQKLTKDVIDEMFDGAYEGIESVTWTGKAMRSYYGMYFPGGIIRINKLLDSPDVDQEIVKFVIYHELLHKRFWRHDKNFYEKEHMYPEYTEHNRFLNHKIRDFKFEW